MAAKLLFVIGASPPRRAPPVGIIVWAAPSMPVFRRPLDCGFAPSSRAILGESDRVAPPFRSIVDPMAPRWVAIEGRAPPTRVSHSSKGSRSATPIGGRHADHFLKGAAERSLRGIADFGRSLRTGARPHVDASRGPLGRGRARACRQSRLGVRTLSACGAYRARRR